MTEISINQLNWKKGKGLLPAIIQDFKTNRVLMLGYMDKTALKLTLEKKTVCFYSRTRQTYWQKGETSGNYLLLKEISLDCDKDCLLIKAEPSGPVCHLQFDTCFAEKNPHTNLYFLHILEHIIENRKSEKPSTSYTANLFSKGIEYISQKLGEEGVETALAGVKPKHDQHLTEEAADLIYHLLVLLNAHNHRLSDVISVLKKRSINPKTEHNPVSFL